MSYKSLNTVLKHLCIYALVGLFALAIGNTVYKLAIGSEETVFASFTWLITLPIAAVVYIFKQLKKHKKNEGTHPSNRVFASSHSAS